jgi:hypothetical protein
VDARPASVKGPLAGFKDFITNLTPGRAESSNGPVRSGILSSKATRSSLDASLNVNNAAPHSAAAQAGFESSQQQQQVTAPAFISKSVSSAKVPPPPQSYVSTAITSETNFQRISIRPKLKLFNRLEISGNLVAAANSSQPLTS